MKRENIIKVKRIKKNLYMKNPPSHPLSMYLNKTAYVHPKLY